MRQIVKQRLDIYKDEEKTLKVMLEEEQEQLKREDDSKRKELMEKGKSLFYYTLSKEGALDSSVL